MRAPYEKKLNTPLAVTEELLYRRGNFNGTWDQIICDALMEVKGADASFSPGVRWGTSILPGETIVYERMMLKGKPMDPNKRYKVADWASVQAPVNDTPIWDVVEEYLRSKKVIKKVVFNEPKIIGIGTKNPGIAGYKGGLS